MRNGTRIARVAGQKQVNVEKLKSSLQKLPNKHLTILMLYFGVQIPNTEEFTALIFEPFKTRRNKTAEALLKHLMTQYHGTVKVS